ncbi:MAG: O-antigen ligase family protein [Candidatus Omnitrophica bacterium]|nr:O-antigen ligase family protein [Candidatus Omnitrophota bacterium]
MKQNRQHMLESRRGSTLLSFCSSLLGLPLLYVGATQHQAEISSTFLLFITILSLTACIVTLVNTNLGLIVLIFSMLLSPEINVAEVPSRAVVMRIDDFLIVTVFFTWLAKMAINKELGLLRVTRINRWILLYCFVAFLSTVKGFVVGTVQLNKAFFYLLKYLEYFVLFFLVVNNVRTEKEVRLFVTFLLVTCVIVVLYADSQIGKIYRVTAPFEGETPESNTLGGYLLLIMGVLFGLLIHYPSWTYRVFLIGLLALMTPAFLATLSRSAWMGTIPMYLTLLLFTRRKRVVLVGIACFGILMGSLFLPRTAVSERALTTFAGPHVQKVFGKQVGFEASASDRIEIWKDTLKTKFLKYPLLGVGVSGVGVVDSQYIRILAEMGILGFVVFLILLTRVAATVWGAYREVQLPFHQGLCLGFLGSLVGLMAHGLTTNTFIIVRIMEPFWFLAGLVIMLPYLEETPQEAVAGKAA